MHKKKVPTMITFENAFKTAMEYARETGIESVGLQDSLHRILAADVVSDMDMPPFNKSAMDGYAIRKDDIKNELKVVETIPAGRIPSKLIRRNECAKIMTGAMVPEGADCVIMVEHTEKVSKDTIKFTGKKQTKTNICPKAEDMKKGDVVIKKREIIYPQHIAILASVGCSKPEVFKKPKVGIIATGSELVEPSEKAPESKIRNSNSYQLFAQTLSIGGNPVNYGIARDTEKAIDAAVRKAKAENDVILISGGVSMGDYDLVPGILKNIGFELLFEKIAIKPGKPTTFGISGDTVCFGLAGNPVSTFVLFEILVKPFLYKTIGHDFIPGMISLPLGKTITRKRSNRMAVIPVAIVNGEKVMPAEYHGSAHVNSFLNADGLLTIPSGTHEIIEGTAVNVRQL